MRSVINFLKQQDRSELTYWLGLIFLFIGLSVWLSVAIALSVTGAVITLESVVTSYLASWIATRN